jgi:tetratricopeptide (TPR) repeat protein
MKQAYTLNEIATLLELPVSQARELATLALGEVRDIFSFQDLVLLRAARGLRDRRLAPAKVERSLQQLKAQLPTGTGVAVGSEGQELVVGVGEAKWNVESGQGLFDFRRHPTPTAAPPTWLKPAPRFDAEAIFEQATAREEAQPTLAIDGYLEVLAAQPAHADAHVNLGRLLHERGRLPEAEAHYVAALVSRPRDPTATFNLAVVLQLDPACIDAYFNLARLYEKKGETMAAIRHLKDYRRLTARMR